MFLSLLSVLRFFCLFVLFWFNLLAKCIYVYVTTGLFHHQPYFKDSMRSHIQSLSHSFTALINFFFSFFKNQVTNSNTFTNTDKLIRQVECEAAAKCSFHSLCAYFFLSGAYQPIHLDICSRRECVVFVSRFITHI